MSFRCPVSSLLPYQASASVCSERPVSSFWRGLKPVFQWSVSKIEGSPLPYVASWLAKTGRHGYSAKIDENAWSRHDDADRKVRLGFCGEESTPKDPKTVTTKLNSCAQIRVATAIIVQPKIWWFRGSCCASACFSLLAGVSGLEVGVRWAFAGL